MIQRNYIKKLWNSVSLEKVRYLVSPTVASIICCVKSSIQLYHGTHNTWSWIEWTIYVFEIFLNGSEISVSSFTSSGYKLEKKNLMHCILRFGVVGGLTLDALSHAMPSSLSLLLLSPPPAKRNKPPSFYQLLTCNLFIRKQDLQKFDMYGWPLEIWLVDTHWKMTI